MRTINLTQHTASEDQLEAGVENVKEGLVEKLTNALNFHEIPSIEELNERVKMLSEIMQQYDPHLTGDVQFMIGGAPYLMAALVQLTPLYRMVFAYSERVSEEKQMPDGSVRKVNIFKHKGFVPMYAHM